MLGDRFFEGSYKYESSSSVIVSTNVRLFFRRRSRHSCHIQCSCRWPLWHKREVSGLNKTIVAGKIEEPVLPVAATPEKAREPNKDDEYDFSPHGYFYLDVEKIPKAFEDIDHLEVTTIDYDKTNADGTDGVPIPPKGLLKTTKEFKFTRIAIYDRQIEFQTETIGGVSYRFSGRYSTPEDYERDSSLSDLTGRLIKIKNGKWAAEMTAGFMWPGC